MKSAATLTISALAVVAAGIFGVGALLATPSTGDDFGEPVEVGPASTGSETGGDDPTRAPSTPTTTPAPTPTPTPTVTTPPPDGTGGQPVDPPAPVRPGDDDGDDDGDDVGDDDGDDGDDDGDDDD